MLAVRPVNPELIVARKRAVTEQTADYPHPPQWSAAWLRRRALSARRRRQIILWTWAWTTLASGVVLLSIPARAVARQRLYLDRSRQYSDINVYLSRHSTAQRRVNADSGRLTTARNRLMAALDAETEQMGPEELARRDSLRAVLSELNVPLERAGSAPLVTSYRALAQSGALRRSTRARALLDSLNAVEQNRSTFGAIGGVDPIFVALTARAGEIGKAIVQLGLGERTALESQIEQLDPALRSAAAAARATRLARDTLSQAESLAESERALGAATASLDSARRRNEALAASVARARVVEAFGGSPVAALAAAIALGLATSFALAMWMEVRRPRAADAYEAEASAAARVIAEIRSAFARPDGLRRKSDLEVPRCIDLLTTTFDELYARLADGAHNLHRVTVCGDSADAAAVVASNLAAAAVRQARTVLLVDGDSAHRAATTLLGVSDRLGLSDLTAGDIEWPAAIAGVTIGRDRTIDVLPAGNPAPGAAGARGTDSTNATPGLAKPGWTLGAVVETVARRYDTVVLALGPAVEQLEGIEGRSLGEVLLVVREGRSEVADVERLAAAVRATGKAVSGVLLWVLDDPSLGELSVAARRPAPSAVSV